MNSLLLAIETSCDETAIAILRGRELLASVVASQIAEHQPYGGVVPEVASRNHLLHAPRLLERAVTDAGVSLGEIDAFAATSGPGLASSLMIGASLAKGLALGFQKPYLAVNHLEGHLLSPFFGSAAGVMPNVALVVSGGHTLLVEVSAVGNYTILGRTQPAKPSTRSRRCSGSIIRADRRSSAARGRAIRSASICRGACSVRETRILVLVA